MSKNTLVSLGDRFEGFIEEQIARGRYDLSQYAKAAGVGSVHIANNEAATAAAERGAGLFA